MNNITIQNVKKVLIVRLGKVGDIVVTSFVFEVLKANFPNVEIHLLTLKSNRDLLRFNPNVNKIYYSGNPMTFLFNILRLNMQHFDLLLDFNDNPSTTTSLIFRLVSCKIKAGYNFSKYSGLLDIHIEQLPQETSHIIERMRNFLTQLGLSIDENIVKPYFYLDPIILSQIQDELKHIKKEDSIIAINISAGSSIRYWKTESWIELINNIFNAYKNICIVLLSTREDKDIRNKILTGLNGTRIVNAGNYSIQHFASYIRMADLMITPDTSAVHIASAFGIPVLALYPNYLWNYVSWQPYKVDHRSVRSDSETIKDIPVDTVFEEFNKLISNNKINIERK